MTLCPTCGNRMAFHEQYRQWYCPMCNASQIEEALRNQEPADLHYQPSQSFFPGVPTSLQATPHSLEDSSPISGSLYCSMPPASQNHYALLHQQELAMALAQRYYQIMQQQGGLPIVADQRQMPQPQSLQQKINDSIAEGKGETPCRVHPTQKYQTVPTLGTTFSNPNFYAQEEFLEEGDYSSMPWYVRFAPRHKETGKPKWRSAGAIIGGVIGSVSGLVAIINNGTWQYGVLALACITAGTIEGYLVGAFIDWRVIKKEFSRERNAELLL